MKSLNGKLLLSAVGIALLATPAYAHKPIHHKQHVAVHHHRSMYLQYVQRPAAPPRSLFMATYAPAPSGYDLDHYFYPGDY
jgi:hypothetical protein